MEHIDTKSMFEKLRKFINSFETKKAAAEFLGISEGHCGDLFHGRRTLSDKIADKMGYAKVVLFVEKNRALHKGMR